MWILVNLKLDSWALCLGKEICFQLSFSFLSPESVDNCPSNCYGNGDCISGTCHCFLGFLGPDCGRGENSALELWISASQTPQAAHFYFSEQVQNPAHLLMPTRRVSKGHSPEALGGRCAGRAITLSAAVIHMWMIGEVRKGG